MTLDFADQKIRNRLRLSFETTTRGWIFDDPRRRIDVPVVIEYTIEGDRVPILSDVDVRIAGQEWSWESIPHRIRHDWRHQMIAAWNTKYGLTVQRMTPGGDDGQGRDERVWPDSRSALGSGD